MDKIFKQYISKPKHQPALDELFDEERHYFENSECHICEGKITSGTDVSEAEYRVLDHDHFVAENFVVLLTLLVI